jgi:hypothetical protein
MKFDNLLKFKAFNLISLILSLVILGAIIYIAFWELNIFKKEKEIPLEIKEIENELTILSKLNLTLLSEELRSKLPQPQVLSQPTISPDMIGKNNWFE